MAREAAILSVLLSANTTEATAKLTKYQRDLDKVELRAKKGIKTQLGGSFDSKAFRAYQEATDKAVVKARDKRAFKAQLGANFSPVGFRAYERALAQAEAESKAATGHMAAAFGRAGQAMKSGLKVGALAIGAAGVVAGKLVIDFDRAMRNVNSIAQLPERTFKRLEQSVLNLAGKTAQAPKTLAEGLYDLVSSGFDAKQSMLILASSAKAATAGLTDTATSTHAVAAVLNAYHRPAKDAAAVSDTLFQTVNLGVISFEQLANTIGDVLPFASQLHVNLNQVGAAVSTMTKAGIGPEETMTRLKNVLVAFIKPSVDMTKAIKATGSASGEALIKQKGLQGALEAIVGTTDGTKSALAALFPNIRGLGGALALTGGNAKGADKDLKAFANTGGATNRALSQQSQSISYQWNLMRSKLEAAAIQFALKVGPLMIGAIKGITAAVEFAKTHATEFANTIVTAWNTAQHVVGTAADHILGVISGMLRGFASVAGIKVLGVQVFGGVSKSINHAADSIDNLRVKLRQLGTAQKQAADTSSIADQKLLHSNQTTFRQMSGNLDQMAAKIKSSTADGSKGGAKNLANFANAVYSAMQSGAVNSKQGVQYIQTALNQTLKAFGAKQIPAAALAAVALSTPFSSAVGAFPKKGVGGGGKPAGAAQGAFINQPTIMTGEEAPRYPEVVLSTNPAYAKRQRGLLTRYLQMAPHVLGFAQGGMVNFDGHPANVSSGVRGLIGTMESRFPGLIVTATTDGGHASGSYHYRGDAVDMASDSATMLAAANYVRTSGLYKSLIEGIHNPNLSVHAGQFVSPSFWGSSTWAAHANHIHLAILGALGALAGGGTISAPRVKGGGTIGNLLRAGLGKVASAANAYIGAHTGGGDSGSFGLPGGVGTSNAANRALGRSMMLGYFPASQWPYLDALWNKESGWSSSARNPSSGAAGIVQDITGNFHGGAAGQIAWGLNYIRGRYGSPAAAWAHEQKFNWYRQGGFLPFAGSFAAGTPRVPGPTGSPSLAVVHGGESIVPTGGLTTLTNVLSQLTAVLKQSLTAGRALPGAGGITPFGFLGGAGASLPNSFLANAGSRLAGIGAAGLGAAPSLTLSGLIASLGRIPSQGIRGQIQLQGLQNQLTTAQNTGNVGGQKSALKRILGLEQKWLTADRAQLKKLNKALRRRGLSKKQRGQLLQDKLALLQEIGTIESDIGSTQTSLNDLASTDTLGGDTGGGVDTSAADAAQQALTDAIAAQTQALADATNAINQQTAAMNAIGAIEKQQAIKALADVISGQIGGQYYSRATGSAGDGRVARY